jgi:hypothetical protein
MTAWSDIQRQPTDKGHFVDEVDLGEIVDNDKNLAERLSDQEALYSFSPVPIGSVVLYFGTYATIPEGWRLCDGTNNLPDLRSRFVLGIKSDEDDNALGNSGGGASHSHNHSTGLTGADGGHDHSVGPQVTSYGTTTYSASTASGAAGISINHAHWFTPTISSVSSHTHAKGATNFADSLPPHKKLFWIGKV